LERQVIVEGTVSRISREESETYFHSRPRANQIGAWASSQSTVVSSRSVLDESMKAVEKKYTGQEIPIPPHWGGYRLAPEAVEFWQGRRGRLHDRIRYRREKDGWVVERLAP
jgi:pyridoxamine 5'-phosphate oxidase